MVCGVSKGFSLSDNKNLFHLVSFLKCHFPVMALCFVVLIYLNIFYDIQGGFLACLIFGLMVIFDPLARSSSQKYLAIWFYLFGRPVSA